jgi:uncharacterized protein YbjT (DUF2867 family)
VRILVTGATGFVGRHLVPVLLEAGHEVRAMTRRPDAYAGPAQPVAGDVDDPGSLAAAMEGCDVVHYLVHGLARSDVATHDAQVAHDLGLAAAALGVRQVVYLGGLGDDGDDLSEHLASRRAVEAALGETGVPVTVLRAAIVIGAGSLSWEILRQTVEQLAVVPTGSWREVRCQPIAVADAVAYLAGVTGHPEALGEVFDVGGPDVLTYGELLLRTAAVLGLDRRLVGVPLLPHQLAALGIRLLTDVDAAVAASLVASLGNEMVVRDDRIAALLPRELLGFDAAVRAALPAED